LNNDDFKENSNDITKKISAGLASLAFAFNAACAGVTQHEIPQAPDLSGKGRIEVIVDPDKLPEEFWEDVPGEYPPEAKSRRIDIAADYIENETGLKVDFESQRHQLRSYYTVGELVDVLIDKQSTSHITELAFEDIGPVETCIVSVFGDQLSQTVGSIYEPGEEKALITAHEQEHCKFEYPTAEDAKNFKVIDAILVNHRNEVTADAQAVARVIAENGFDNTAIKQADLRSAHSFERSHNILQKNPDLEFTPFEPANEKTVVNDDGTINPKALQISTIAAGTLPHNSSRTLRALDEYIDETGIENFRALPEDQRREIVDNLIEENLYTPEEFIHAQSYNAMGKDYLEVLEASAESDPGVASARDFIKSYKEDVEISRTRLDESQSNPEVYQRDRPEIESSSPVISAELTTRAAPTAPRVP